MQVGRIYKYTPSSGKEKHNKHVVCIVAEPRLGYHGRPVYQKHISFICDEEEDNNNKTSGCVVGKSGEFDIALNAVACRNRQGESRFEITLGDLYYHAAQNSCAAGKSATICKIAYNQEVDAAALGVQENWLFDPVPCPTSIPQMTDRVGFTIKILHFHYYIVYIDNQKNVTNYVRIRLFSKTQLCLRKSEAHKAVSVKQMQQKYSDIAAKGRPSSSLALNFVFDKEDDDPIE